MSKFIRVFAAAVLLAGLPMAALAQPANVNVTVQVHGANQLAVLSRAINCRLRLAVTNGVDSIDRRPAAVTLTCNRGAAPLGTC